MGCPVKVQIATIGEVKVQICIFRVMVFDPLLRLRLLVSSPVHFGVKTVVANQDIMVKREWN